MLQPNSNEQKLSNEFICIHCGKRYVREERFLAHKCKERERFELMQGPKGKFGLLMYNRWIYKKYRGKSVTSDVFTTSSMFTCIMKFVDWGLAMRFNSSMFERYVDYCVSRNFPPNMWLMNDVFVQFVQFLDSSLTAKEHVEISLEWMQSVSSDKKCELVQVLDNVVVGEIIQAILHRKLSPWVLIKTSGFKRMWAKCNDDAKNQLHQVINGDYWRKKMSDDQNGTALISAVIQQIGL